MDLTEQRMQMDAARQLAVMKELRAHLQSQAKSSSESAAQQKRFY